MHNTPKITPADYPDLLQAVDAGTTQRELARRYDCAPSLAARHVARAKRSRDLSEPTHRADPGVTAAEHNSSMREILEARIRDPKTSARDLSSLVNSLAKLDGEDGGSAEKGTPSDHIAAFLQPGDHWRLVDEEGNVRLDIWKPLNPEHGLISRPPFHDDEREPPEPTLYGPGNRWPPPWEIRGFEKWPVSVPPDAEYDGEPTDDQLRAWSRK